MSTTSILLVGVGGQGTILVSKIMTEGLLKLGYDVKMSEIHGMSQRGGSVNTQIRFGEKVYAPTIDKGQSDYLVSFEEMETYRWLPYLKPGGQVIMNDYRQPSSPMLSGAVPYPEGLKEEIMAKVDTTVIKAADIALGLGLPRSMNIVLLGALIKMLKLTEVDWPEVLKNNIKPQFLDGNLKALEKGMEAYGQ